MENLQQRLASADSMHRLSNAYNFAAASPTCPSLDAFRRLAGFISHTAPPSQAAFETAEQNTMLVGAEEEEEDDEEMEEDFGQRFKGQLTSHSKPPYSYIALIAMAIKNAPDRKITLNGKLL